MWTIQPKAQAQGGGNTRLSPVIEKAPLAVAAATCWGGTTHGYPLGGDNTRVSPNYGVNSSAFFSVLR